MARPSTETVADIVSAVEGPIALTECMTTQGAVSEIEALCPTRTNWRHINNALVEALDNVSLADMAKPVFNPGSLQQTPAVAGVTALGAQ